MAFQLYVGDRSPSMPFVFEIDGDPVDISGMSITFTMIDQATGLVKVDHRPATLTTDGLDGAAQYDWAALDVTPEGVYDSYAEATIGASVIQSLDLGEVRVDRHGVVTLAELREHVETGLVDRALQLLLDDALASVAQHAKATGQRTEIYDTYGMRTFRLHEPAVSVSLIEEQMGGSLPWITVDPSIYRLEDGGQTVRYTGFYWGLAGDFTRVHRARFTRVTYTPASDVATRKRVTIDLVRLATQYSGLSSEKIGTYSASPLDLTSERERLLSQLNKRKPGLRFA